MYSMYVDMYVIAKKIKAEPSLAESNLPHTLWTWEGHTHKDQSIKGLPNPHFMKSASGLMQTL